jgi:hypothetical protein
LISPRFSFKISACTYHHHHHHASKEEGGGWSRRKGRCQSG